MKFTNRAIVKILGAEDVMSYRDGVVTLRDGRSRKIAVHRSTMQRVVLIDGEAAALSLAALRALGIDNAR